MKPHEKRWHAALAAVPNCPRTLFQLHIFCGQEIHVIADRLAVTRSELEELFRDIRRVIAANHWLSADQRQWAIPATELVAPIEERLRLDYREWLGETFRASGYIEPIKWPDPVGSIGEDQEAAAAAIVAQLRPDLRQIACRFSTFDPDGISVRRIAPWWRPGLRRRLWRIVQDIRLSGWSSFEVWIADRINPDLFYPNGIHRGGRRRRPFPGEPAYLPPESEPSPEPATMHKRIKALAPLTRDIWILHGSYGRSHGEIADHMGISQRRVDRGIWDAIHVINGSNVPTLAGWVAEQWRRRWAIHRPRLAIRFRRAEGS